MDTSESHKYRQVYIKSFLPLTAFFSIICLIGVFGDYVSFVESRKHHNERAIKGLQELLQTRINNIKEEANIIETRINHANSINKIVQVLGTPVFNTSKHSRIFPFIASHYILERDKRFFISPYGISDLTDFPRELLQKFSTVSPRGEFYLWDDALYYIRRIKHASSKQLDGILILSCEAKGMIDSGHKPDHINIVLSSNIYPFLQPDKLDKTYGSLPNSITIFGNIYDHYVVIPETPLALFAKLQEENAYKIYIKQRTTLWAALLMLFLLIISSHLMFKFVFLIKISKLKHKTSTEIQYAESIKEREKILKDVFLRQQEDIKILIASHYVISRYIEGSLNTDILTLQGLEELNLTVEKPSDALEEGILYPTKFEDIDVSEILHKSILFLFPDIYNKEVKISFQHSMPGIINHDPLIIELLFINVLKNIIKRSPHASFINILMRINNDILVVDIIDQGYIHEIKTFTHDFSNKRGDLFSLENDRVLKLAEGANINIKVKNEFAPPRNSTIIEIPLKAFPLEKAMPANVIQFRGK